MSPRFHSSLYHVTIVYDLGLIFPLTSALVYAFMDWLLLQKMQINGSQS